MGPALPDLQIIGDVPLQQATWLFTGFAIGYLGGCLLAGLSEYNYSPHISTEELFGCMSVLLFYGYGESHKNCFYV